MRVSQDEYEKKTRDELIAKLNEIQRIAAHIGSAAGTNQPLPIAPQEFLKKISIVIAACQSIITEHIEGDGVSDATLHTVATALQEMHQSIDSLILHAAIKNIRR